MMRPRNKIMILDDEPIVSERLQPALEKVGFIVESFTDSQEAIQRLAKERFDVLVTDLKMQKPDGLDVMAYVHERWPDTNVIVITGYATVETAREAMKGGAVDFIAKPFKISDLKELIIKITSSEKS